MIVADIMTHPALAIDAQTPLVQAIRLMTQHKISGLPVVERDGRIVGMLTEGDLLRRVETGTAGEAPVWLVGALMPGREARKYTQTHGRSVGDVMTRDVITVQADMTLSEAVGLMQRRHVKRLPVVQDGKLLGIVSRADLVRQVGEALSDTPASADDATLLSAVEKAMQKEVWAPSQMISVTVVDGVVQFDGCLFDSRLREALSVLAANVRGVKAVENRIVCVEPNTGIVTFDPAA
jgi:CBS domain-containing protein